MQNVNVTLNQADLEFVASLSPELQETARAQRLEAKAKAKLAYLNDPKTKARLDRAQHNRSVVRGQVTPRQALSMYGLGQKFPITLSKSQWELLLSDEVQAIIRAALVGLPERALPKSAIKSK